jgi:ABC-type glycerol-3-phosphate transport system substrate-binding protein
MNNSFLFSLTFLESPSLSASAETVIKILHINPIPKVHEIWRSAAVEYENAHPAVKIQFDYLENEEFKAKLPALLQSKDHPSVFHSWGGGVMLEQVQVDPSKIEYWEDLLESVKRCKEAGITPIAVGGSDKWPLQFYPALLMMRILGKDGMASAYKGDHGGFAGLDLVKAWKMYKELCDLVPFQEGFQTMAAVRELKRDGIESLISSLTLTTNCSEPSCSKTHLKPGRPSMGKRLILGCEQSQRSSGSRPGTAQRQKSNFLSVQNQS